MDSIPELQLGDSETEAVMVYNSLVRRVQRRGPTTLQDK